MLFRFAVNLLAVATVCCLVTVDVSAQLSRHATIHSVKTTTKKPNTTFNPQEGDFCGMATMSCVAVDLTGNPTGGSDGPNTFINVDLMTGGVDATILGFGWDVDVQSADPSWRSEVTVDVAGVFVLEPGQGDDVTGSMRYTSGGIEDLTQVDENGDGSVISDFSFVATAGQFTLELFESFDDSAVSPDGMYGADSTLTIEYMLPFTGIPGDYDGNGLVAAGDLNLVLNNWGLDGTIPPEGWVNDFPVDVISAGELNTVLSEWGNGPFAVPEPSGVALICFGLMGLVRRIRSAA